MNSGPVSMICIEHHNWESGKGGVLEKVPPFSQSFFHSPMYLTTNSNYLCNCVNSEGIGISCRIYNVESGHTTKEYFLQFQNDVCGIMVCGSGRKNGRKNG